MHAVTVSERAMPNPVGFTQTYVVVTCDELSLLSQPTIFPSLGRIHIQNCALANTTLVLTWLSSLLGKYAVIHSCGAEEETVS